MFWRSCICGTLSISLSSMSKSRPCGVVNARDALQALLGEVEDEEALLRAYVAGIGYR